MSYVQTSHSLSTGPNGARPIGDPVALPADSVVVFDAVVRSIKADGSKSKVLSVQQVYQNDGGAITAGSLTNLISPIELGGTLGVTFSIDRTGSVCQPKITSTEGSDIKHEVELQVSTTAYQSQSLDAFLANPALQVTAFWKKGNYAVDGGTGYGTWTGSAGGLDAIGGTNSPTDSSGVPDFDGTNDGLVSAATLAQLFDATTGGTIIVIANGDNPASAPAANCYDDVAIFSDYDNGHLGVSFTTSGVKAFLYDGGYKTRTISQSTGAWFFAAMRWDGTDLHLLTGDGSNDTTVACGALSGAGGTIAIGKTYNGGDFFDGKIRLVICAKGLMTLADVKTIYQLAQTEGLV